jgi:hypothetical protein
MVLAGFVTATIIAVHCFALCTSAAASARHEEDEMPFYPNLGPGWNLGNCLDAHIAGYVSEEPTDYEKLEAVFTSINMIESMHENKEKTGAFVSE